VIRHIPFDGWTPSSAHFGEGWATVRDLAPVFDSWRPWHQFIAITTAGAAFGPCVGTYTHLWPSGVATTTYTPDADTLFTGSPTRLFTVNPSTGAFTNVSRAANYGAGVGTTPAGWRFASVGNDIWAVNWFDVPQRRVANAGLFTDGVVSTFVPVARHIAVIREHLVLANLNQALRFVDEFVWSDADNATNFDPPTGTSTSIAGSKRLISTPGQITALIGGQYGLAFKRKSIYYLEYAGGTQVFRPEVLSAHIGTAYASSILNTRYGRFFFGPDGFYKMIGLAEPEKISPPGLDATLLQTLFSTQGAVAANLEDSQMIGFEVPGMPLIGWLFRNDWLLPGNDQVILHNPITGAWALGRGSAVDPASEETVLATTGVFLRPYASTVWDTVAALTWDTSNSRLAPLSSTETWGPELRMNYRPNAFEEEADKTNAQVRQSITKGVLPIVSRGSDDLTARVDVEKLLDPFAWPTDAPLPPESRAYTERNAISGYYPFQIAGRLFRISVIFTKGEDFNHFHGIYVDQEVLT